MSFDFVQSDIKRIEDLAFEWATDYKPWDDDLSPQKYAEHGFLQGYLRAVQEISEKVEKLQKDLLQ